LGDLILRQLLKQRILLDEIWQWWSWQKACIVGEINERGGDREDKIDTFLKLDI
jgi:hypothetical protein